MEKVLLATCWKLRKYYSVFARHWPKNTVNTVIFVTRGKTHRKYRGFGLPRRKKTICIYGVFGSELQKNVKTPPIWRFSATTGNRQSRSFFKEMSIFSCVEAFPGSRAFLENASKLWWSQRNHVFKCFCVFSCVQLGFRYLVMLWVYVVFVAFSWGEAFFVAVAFLSVTSVRSTVFSNYCQIAAQLLAVAQLLPLATAKLLLDCFWTTTTRLTSFQVTWSRITPACAQCFV